MNGTTKGDDYGYDETGEDRTFRDFMQWCDTESWFEAEEELDLETGFPLAA